MPRRIDRPDNYYTVLATRFKKRKQYESHERWLHNQQILMWLHSQDVEYDVNRQNKSVIFKYRMVTYTYYMSTGRLMYVHMGKRTFFNGNWQTVVEHIWHFADGTLPIQLARKALS